MLAKKQLTIHSQRRDNMFGKKPLRTIRSKGPLTSSTDVGRPTKSSSVSSSTQTGHRTALPNDGTRDPAGSEGAGNECAPVLSFATASFRLGFPREPFIPAVSPTPYESFSTSPSTSQVQADSAQSTGSVPALVAAPRFPQKKALLIGLNYEQCGKEKHLRHATNDAQYFSAALTKLGYSTGNTRVVTDEGQSSASREYLLECMDWLIGGASEGDRLFFMFSGHCLFPRGEKEPHLLAADTKTISRSTFQECLVSKVPAGAELNIVLDCSHAAGMVKLKYRIGQMVPELAALPIRSVGALGGLYGPRGLALSVQTAHAMINHTPVGTPTNTRPRRGVRGGLTASQPLSYQVTPNHRQLVVQGHPFAHFQEHQDAFVSPAGKVVVWAGTGERLKAFEASGGVKNGIVTNAFCRALDKCHDSATTRRDLWKSLVGAIDEENRCRRERDARKPNSCNIPISTRIQLAELWVSQDEPLSSASPILNQAFERPWNLCEATA
ncbi:unnamed protein product [Rhizoctonia solani]|uniref:Peptidase C14 caspase domain-containing protein n=1 Tax=Rhizoctonia solani TaxID=456999 RepID=A0A8H3BHM1_9AGAM|nr:unnamed protein product [Rhizoctonia solani]